MSRFMKVVIAAVLGLWAVTAQAAEPKRAALSEADKADVARAEDYLNAVTTLKARFLQVSPNGASVEGDAYLSRPGKLRLQYDPPSPLLVVADGTFLIVHDSQLGEPSWLPLNSTPAGVLVRPNVKLTGGDVAVTRVTRMPGVVRVSLVGVEDPAAGEITLVFSDRPFLLRQWQVKDAQNQITTVSLFEAQSGLSLDPKLFEFKDPKFTKPKLNL
ncbi:outer membrane lipoprotein carrier protein LolA [Paramagnetospirillum kuznetsovii]|uniref:Outer membrane lipoprotein carrier protein LolA n=1 Tax=Paramagnetospirillum kuznetsovii TaxID=2053833 RepID=A0A364P311_9PROT|nr:outer membrane lipoprotein carrier protein LolA [Paramagnetospirillum kuznetsovii]RAU23739.1 outer membrane lipoprotein carrier protein LolA [Paramagnetospirillum kuznetsovii]